MKFRVNGTVTYQNIETGFWSVIGDDGKQYRPVNFPEQIKLEGKKVRLTLKNVDEAASIFMWGIPVEVVAFHT
jgi:hypothetical protein